MIQTYYEPWVDEWATGGTLTYEVRAGVFWVLGWEPNKMPTFHDALSGEKRKLNVRERTHTVVTAQAWCANEKYGHDFPSQEDETCKCKRCGMSLLFSRALINLDKQKHRGRICE